MTHGDREYVPAELGGLLGVTRCLSGIDSADLRQHGEVLLHHPPSCAGSLGGRSDLNWNGSPLQLLVSVKSGGSRHRLIGDPGFFHPNPITRLRESVDALEQTLRAGQAYDLWSVCWQSLVSTLPKGAEALEKYPHGMIRLAIALDGPGAGVYVGAEAHPPAAWRRAREWLSEVLPEDDEAHRLISRLEPCAHLFGVGVEGRAPHEGRAKLYWRMSQPVGLSCFGVDLFESPPIVAFLSVLMGDRPLPLKGLTFSVGFSLRTGAMQDAKVDVCLKSAKLDGRDAIALSRPLAEEAGLDIPLTVALFDTLAENSVSVGCVGLGADRKGAHRMNVYLFQSPRDLAIDRRRGARGLALAASGLESELP